MCWNLFDLFCLVNIYSLKETSDLYLGRNNANEKSCQINLTEVVAAMEAKWRRKTNQTLNNNFSTKKKIDLNNEWNEWRDQNIQFLFEVRMKFSRDAVQRSSHSALAYLQCKKTWRNKVKKKPSNRIDFFASECFALLMFAILFNTHTHTHTFWLLVVVSGSVWIFMLCVFVCVCVRLKFFSMAHSLLGLVLKSTTPFGRWLKPIHCVCVCACVCVCVCVYTRTLQNLIRVIYSF